MSTIPRSRDNRTKSGYTMVDVVVVLAGIVPALWVSRYFHGGWRTAILYASTFLFGIGFWCFLFLWLLPLIHRRRHDRRESES